MIQQGTGTGLSHLSQKHGNSKDILRDLRRGQATFPKAGGILNEHALLPNACGSPLGPAGETNEVAPQLCHQTTKYSQLAKDVRWQWALFCVSKDGCIMASGLEESSKTCC